MGLFRKKDATEALNMEEVKSVAVKEATLSSPYDITQVIERPHITEKAATLLERNVYTFLVKKGATKHAVRDAITLLYKVTPVAVRIVNKSPRHYMSRMRSRDMLESGQRKAYVYLKKGDRIDLV